MEIVSRSIRPLGIVFRMIFKRESLAITPDVTAGSVLQAPYFMKGAADKFNACPVVRLILAVSQDGGNHFIDIATAGPHEKA